MEHISKSQIKLVRSLQQKKFRDETGMFVAEGEKCVEELRKTFDLYMLINHTNATDKEIEQMSTMRTPQGIIGVFKKRNLTDLPDAGNQLLLALDGVQDPGNLGTIIRTADWFGITDILCSTDTADCYNPKVIQATMGSLARVRLHYIQLADYLQQLPAKVSIYGTLLDGQNIYKEKLNKNNGIILMGNEGNGISQQIRPFITKPLLIPSFQQCDHAESLNVAIATAIVLSEFRRNQ